MVSIDPKLHESWKSQIADEFQKPYMGELKGFLKTQYTAGKTIYPKGSEYFRALNSTAFQDVKVVILGQDPYHGPEQAHGLCFSVPKGTAIPPSLRNIYKELNSDLGIETPKHGDLSEWSQRGVLLLNSVLTVENGLAASHAGKGWELFSDRIIHELNLHREHLVFILWGSYAQKKGQFIDPKKHLVIKGPHPSPLSSHRGFFGSKPFSKTNHYLLSHGIRPIKWELSSLQ